MDRVLHQVADDPMFKVSENNVLFLKEPSPGLHYAIGRPSRRLDITSGPITLFATNGTKFAVTADDFATAAKDL